MSFPQLQNLAFFLSGAAFLPGARGAAVPVLLEALFVTGLVGSSSDSGSVVLPSSANVEGAARFLAFCLDSATTLGASCFLALDDGAADDVASFLGGGSSSSELDSKLQRYH